MRKFITYPFKIFGMIILAISIPTLMLMAYIVGGSDEIERLRKGYADLLIAFAPTGE